MSLRDDLLPVFDNVRGLIDELGFRRYDLSLRLTTWSGQVVGDGTSVVTETPITLDAAGHRIKIRRVETRSEKGHDVVASGGQYQAGDFRVGPITPTFSGPSGTGGHEPSYFDPPVGVQPTEVAFILRGPGFPADGAIAKKVAQETDRNFGLYFTLRLS